MGPSDTDPSEPSASVRLGEKFLRKKKSLRYAVRPPKVVDIFDIMCYNISVKRKRC